MPVELVITLIEDDADDIEFLTEALRNYGGTFEMNQITRGDLAIEWSENIEKVPQLIIMDLNLPKVHGRDVLKKLCETPRLKAVPIVVLTTSSMPEDRDFCVAHGATRFITKPSSPEDYQLLVETLYHLARERELIKHKPGSL